MACEKKDPVGKRRLARTLNDDTTTRPRCAVRLQAREIRKGAREISRGETRSQSRQSHLPAAHRMTEASSRGTSLPKQSLPALSSLRGLLATVEISGRDGGNSCVTGALSVVERADYSNAHNIYLRAMSIQIYDITLSNDGNLRNSSLKRASSAG